MSSGFLLHFQFFFPVHPLPRLQSLLWDCSQIFPKAGNISKTLTARKQPQSQTCLRVNLNVDLFSSKRVTRLSHQVLQSPDVTRTLLKSKLSTVFTVLPRDRQCCRCWKHQDNTTHSLIRHYSQELGKPFCAFMQSQVIHATSNKTKRESCSAAVFSALHH